MERTKNGFDRKALPELLQVANVIVASMTEHVALFPSPDPKLSVVQELIRNLEQADVAAASGDRYKIALRNEKRKALVNALRQLGIYVNLVAAADPDNADAIIEASGFPRAKSPSPKPGISYVPTPKLGAGTSGQVIVHGTSFPGLTYLVRYSTNHALPIDEWKFIPSYQSKCMLENLQPAQRYFVRQCVINRNGSMVYSEPASIVTQ